jgi:hypothetical protein
MLSLPSDAPSAPAASTDATRIYARLAARRNSPELKVVSQVDGIIPFTQQRPDLVAAE